MTVFYPDYQIAAGNNNVAGLVAIESITPAGDHAFFCPRGYGFYNPGDFKIRGTGLMFNSGFPSVTWRFTVMTFEQDYYLRNTIFGDSAAWSGLVTVRTDARREGTFANYNAVLILPKPVELTWRAPVFVDYDLLYTRLVAL